MLDDHDRPSDHPIDAAIDEAEKESFPASDPQSSWAGPDPVALIPEPTLPGQGGTTTNRRSQGSSDPESAPTA
jgi:hypothetical protein